MFKSNISEFPSSFGDEFKRLEAAYHEQFTTTHALRYFSSPGRSEIAGNHTDHQNGKVIVATVDLATNAVVEAREDSQVVFYSEGFGTTSLDLASLDIVAEEYETSAALVRGVAKGMQKKGYLVGGFNAYIASQVPAGSGLSSSAAFELLLVSIFDNLYNEGSIPPLVRAQIGQYAENVYFNKPSGLLDQSGSSFGDLIYIDFADETPQTVPLHLNLEDVGYKILIVLTGGSHANLTSEYAAIPKEMNEVAKLLGEKHLTYVSPKTFYNSLAKLRQSVSDRAILRAMHFFSEQKLVEDMREAIETNHFEKFLGLVNQSGLSSELLLQNVRVDGDYKDQGLSLALAITRRYLFDKKGACRVHGGGFAGTIQVYMKNEHIAEYRSMMENIFGENTVLEVSIRPQGACQIER